jgi:hypothetical protein
MKILFICIFLVLNGPIPSFGKPIQEPQKKAADASQSARDQKQPSQRSAPAVAPILKPNTTSQTETKTPEISNNENKKATTDWWLVAFTGALAIVAALQLATLVWQILTSRDATRKELRAYVLPVSATHYTENGVRKLKIVLRNSGKTPALDCITETFHGVGPIIKPLPELPHVDTENSAHSLSFLGSDQETWIHGDMETIASTNENAIRNDRGAVYIIGKVTYLDVFKVNHISRFRFMSSGSNFDTGMYVFCDEGNSTE